MRSCAPTHIWIGTFTDINALACLKKSVGGAKSASRVNFHFDPEITFSPARVCALPPTSASNVTVPIEWPMPTSGRSVRAYVSADASIRRIRSSSSALVGIAEASMSKHGAMIVQPKSARERSNERWRKGFPPSPTANRPTHLGCSASMIITSNASAPSLSVAQEYVFILAPSARLALAV